MFRQHLLTTSRRGTVVFRRQLTDSAGADSVRSRMVAELKVAMKARDSLKGTAIRSVLTEVYSADKQKAELIPSNKIQEIIRKAVDRRKEVAVEYTELKRSDLAEKELSEAAFLSTFLPPQLSEEEIDRVLREVIQGQDLSEVKSPKQALGKIFKAFYTQVDKSAIGSTEFVTQRAEAILAEGTKS